MFGGFVDWWQNRPPVAVFVVTLAACALTLASIAVYVNVHKHNLPDPNVKNWNSFFTTLSKLQVCVPGSIDDLPDKDEPAKAQVIESNYSALVGISLMTNEESSLNYQLAHNRLMILITEEDMGRRASLGHTSEELIMSIGLPTSDVELPGSSEEEEEDNESEKNHSQLKDHSKEEEIDTKGKKGTKVIKACLTFKGPARLLPNSVVLPIPCQQRLLPILNASVSAPCQDSYVSYKLNLNTQPHLTQLLTQEETILIELHLLYTTCALILLVALVLGYAICRRLDLQRRGPASATTTGLLNNDWLNKELPGEV